MAIIGCWNCPSSYESQTLYCGRCGAPTEKPAPKDKGAKKKGTGTIKIADEKLPDVTPKEPAS